MIITDKDKDGFKVIFKLIEELDRIGAYYFRTYLKYLNTIEQTKKVTELKTFLLMIIGTKEILDL